MDYSSWQEGSADVRMCGYADMRMCRCADVQMWGCADGAGVHGSWFIVHGRRDVREFMVHGSWQEGCADVLMCGCVDVRMVREFSRWFKGS